MQEKELAIMIVENINILDNLVKGVANIGMKNIDRFTVKQFFTLLQIRKYEKIELKNLSKDLYVSTSSLCVLLNRLVENGYVSREEDPRDRRNTFYGITEEGKAVLEEEEANIVRALSEGMNKFDDKFKKDIDKSLRVLIKAAERLY